MDIRYSRRLAQLFNTQAIADLPLEVREAIASACEEAGSVTRVKNKFFRFLLDRGIEELIGSDRA